MICGGIPSDELFKAIEAMLIENISKKQKSNPENTVYGLYLLFFTKFQSSSLEEYDKEKNNNLIKSFDKIGFIDSDNIILYFSTFYIVSQNSKNLYYFFKINPKFDWMTYLVDQVKKSTKTISSCIIEIFIKILHKYSLSYKQSPILLLPLETIENLYTINDAYMNKITVDVINEILSLSYVYPFDSRFYNIIKGYFLFSESKSILMNNQFSKLYFVIYERELIMFKVNFLF